ncbi:MAG TPA: vitamin K epoxide reductase family protein [Cyclobacteriaceae bacterium]|nr:vitamin K epoxide reductase family protein [Cyclobacteriaceae bacterium]
MKNHEIPPGWDYNPASWSQRIPIVLLAVLGLCIASYLAFYQLEWFDNVWEPFFGNGSEKILNSHISSILPVPDAALGALGYFVDALAGVVGGKQRWHKMPWIVIIFGVAVGPLGLVSLLLVIAQPVMLNAWCTLCLISAAISVVMIGPAMDEVLASLQYMKRIRKPDSKWKAFWGLTKAIRINEA